MIVGFGIDLTSVRRFDTLIQNERFLTRFFTESERAYVFSSGHAAQAAAGLFCAKEAYAKATGLGIFGFCWKDVEIDHAPSGQPILKVSNADPDLRFHLSIAHDAGMAMASVICEQV